MTMSGMTVEDVAAAMNVPIVQTNEWSWRNIMETIGRPPGYAGLATLDGTTVVLCRRCSPSYADDVIADVLHELAHLTHSYSFKDEYPILAWQALVITRLDPWLSADLRADMEGYNIWWSGSREHGRHGSVIDSIGSFEHWIHSDDFAKLARVAMGLGIVDDQLRPFVRKVNP